MQSGFPVVPGGDVPVLPAADLRRRWIARRARASEHVVDLLLELALGSRDDAGWPPVPADPHLVEVAYA